MKCRLLPDYGIWALQALRTEVKRVKRELDLLVAQMHADGVSYEAAVREFKRRYLLQVLVSNRGNQCKSAEVLGMHRNTLSRTLAELELDTAAIRAGLKRPSRSEQGSDLSRLHLANSR